MKTIIKNILNSSSNISMYVGLIFVAYNMLKDNDFSSEPAVTAIIIISLLIFSILRYVSYRITIEEIRNNQDSFISYKIDKGF